MAQPEDKATSSNNYDKHCIVFAARDKGERNNLGHLGK